MSPHFRDGRVHARNLGVKGLKHSGIIVSFQEREENEKLIKKLQDMGIGVDRK